jgi:hypothetical protein
MIEAADVPKNRQQHAQRGGPMPSVAVGADVRLRR